MRSLTTISRLFCVCGIFGLLAMGCTDTEETREIEFSLSRYSVAFAVGGGITSLTVGTSDSWSASTDATWLSLSQDGSTLYITAEANDVTAEIREAEITVSTSSYGSATVQVRQEPAEAAELSVNYGSSDCAFDSEGGTLTFAVTSSCDWTVSLAEEIDGWELSKNETSGTFTLTAGVNEGSTIYGTVIVTAGSGELAATEEVVILQTSRADNPYFQFIDTWDLNSADCYYGGTWYGTSGTYGTCSIADYSYATGTLSMLNWGGLNGLENDNLQYNAGEKSLTFPLGYLAGSMYTSSGLYYYMYLVAFDTAFSGWLGSSTAIKFNLSEDGGTITASDIPEDHPVLGWLGYNAYYGYVLVSNAPYVEAPLTLTRSQETETSLSVTPRNFTITPVRELPEGIPARISDGDLSDLNVL